MFNDALTDLDNHSYNFYQDSWGFAKQEIKPHAQTIAEQDHFPSELWEKLGNQKLLGITVSPTYGGLGYSYLHHVLAMQAISRASAAVGLSYCAHSNLCVSQLARVANTTQQQTFLPNLIAGHTIGGLAMSEDNAGSDVLSMTTSASPSPTGYTLNGHKMWITNAPIADILLVYAQTKLPNSNNQPTSNDANRKISAFIVPRKTPGLICHPSLDKIGMRGSPTGRIEFNNCQIPAANLLGDLGNAHTILMQGLNYERLILCGGPLGIIEACFDILLPHLATRHQFGQPLGKQPTIQAQLADLYTEYRAASSLVYQTAHRLNTQQPTHYDSSVAYLFVARTATKIAQTTMQLMGARGYMTGHPAARMVNDAKLYEIGGGTNEIRQLLIGRELYKKFKTQEVVHE